jgi:hypothetical protein
MINNYNFVLLINYFTYSPIQRVIIIVKMALYMC